MRCRVIHPHLQFLLHSVLRAMLALLLRHLMSNVVKMHAFHAESRMDAPLPDRQCASILRMPGRIHRFCSTCSSMLRVAGAAARPLPSILHMLSSGGLPRG